MGIIVDGKYYPTADVPKEIKPSTTLSAIHEQNTYERIYEKHAHELIQPNNPDGSINKDFADYYPEDAENHGHVPESEKI